MGDGLTIRRAAEEDYESVRVLEELEFQMHRAARPDYFKEAAETYGRGEFLGLLSMPCPIAWLAEWSGQVVALCLGKIGRSTESEICKSRKVASVEDLVTLPEFRGRGIGTALLERAREQAREEGAEFTGAACMGLQPQCNTALQASWHARAVLPDGGAAVTGADSIEIFGWIQYNNCIHRVIPVDFRSKGGRQYGHQGVSGRSQGKTSGCHRDRRIQHAADQNAPSRGYFRDSL